MNSFDSVPHTTVDLPPSAVCLALSESPTGAIVAATTLGLAWTTSGDSSWRLQDGSPILEDIAFSPRFSEDQTIYGVQDGDLIGSHDAGRTWRLLLSGSRLLTVRTSRSNRSTVVFAGAEADGIFRSDDGGNHWESVTPGLLDLTVLSISVSPGFASDKTVLLGTPTGLYRSRNGGHAWRRLTLPVEEPCVQSIAISQTNCSDNLFIVGTETDGLFVSRDRGRSWEAFDEQGLGVTTIASGPSGVIAVAGEKGIALSIDDGDTWRWGFDQAAPILSMLLSSGPPGHSATLYCGPASGGITTIGIDTL